MMNNEKPDYAGLYASAEVDPLRYNTVFSQVLSLWADRECYFEVERRTGIPWWNVAVIHCLESGCDFMRHLHNGDPLFTRTVNAPAGRPVADPEHGLECGYSWQESAQDALRDTWRPSGPWDISGCLEFLERFNGLGYWKHGVNSPYLWSFTNQYVKGKFITDGTFDPEAVSGQTGAAALFKVMQSRSMIYFAGGQK